MAEAVFAGIDPGELRRDDFDELWADRHDGVGYRFHQLVLRTLIPGMPEAERRALLVQAAEAGNRRGDWLAESIRRLA